MERRVLLDTNLLMLLIAGLTDLRIIRSHKRLQMFRAIDYHLVREFLARNGALLLLPNVATETSNFLAHMRDPEKTALRRTMRTIVDTHCETVIPSRIAVARPEFLRLGLTDAAILQAMNDTTT